MLYSQRGLFFVRYSRPLSLTQPERSDLTNSAIMIECVSFLNIFFSFQRNDFHSLVFCTTQKCLIMERRTGVGDDDVEWHKVVHDADTHSIWT